MVLPTIEHAEIGGCVHNIKKSGNRGKEMSNDESISAHLCCSQSLSCACPFFSGIVE
jgi:hypothetical protein